MIPLRFPLMAALVCAPFCARAEEPLRLADISVSRFVERAPGQVWLERGLFGPFKGFRVVDESPVLSSVTVPSDARNKMLITLEAWYAYGRLGTEALVNFVMSEDGPYYQIGTREYRPVSMATYLKLNSGKLVNISTRGFASTTNKLIGGFAVDEQHRWVLIRAVGPGLANYGVADYLRDPYLTLFKRQTIIGYNDDWGKRLDSDQTAASAVKVGAFALATGSKDAAMLVELEPGNYTVQVEPESGEAGTALIEVYSVPES